MPSNYHIHSREFEVGVLQFFADLYQLPTEEMWGYGERSVDLTLTLSVGWSATVRERMLRR